MDRENQERLRKNHILIKGTLQILPVLDHMYQEGVLTADEEELIRCQQITSEKCQKFLEILARRGNKGYTTFCKVLKDLQPELLKAIEDTKLDKGTETDEADANNGDILRPQEGKNGVTGLRDNAKAETANTAANVIGGMGHNTVYNTYNYMDGQNQPSMDNTSTASTKEQGDHIINVTGVMDKATVGTANVAGHVYGGMGNGK